MFNSQLFAEGEVNISATSTGNIHYPDIHWAWEVNNCLNKIT